ncbi:MAG TPA: hypothetical protein VMX16_19115 [Terriglobia bacterium]|nr:hypothetical protein [Terriglobia bacterium]
MLIQRSALFYCHQRAGAHFVTHHGWQMPDVFSSLDEEVALVTSGVGIADVSYRIKYDTRIQPAGPGWSLGFGHFLVVSEPPLDPPEGATDVTSVYADLLMAGPFSREVLGKLSSLNLSNESLPNLSCVQGSVAHVHTILRREDLGSMPAFHLLVSREYAESVWQIILQSGREFQANPFGMKALQSLRG